MQERETEQEKRTTIQEYSKLLGVSQPLLSIWLKGNTKPSDKKIIILAKKIGVEIYDSLGISQPDPLLQYIIENWNDLPKEKKEYIIRIVKKHTNNPLSNKSKTLE